MALDQLRYIRNINNGNLCSGFITSFNQDELHYEWTSTDDRVKLISKFGESFLNYIPILRAERRDDNKYYMYIIPYINKYSFI